MKDFEGVVALHGRSDTRRHREFDRFGLKNGGDSHLAMRARGFDQFSLKIGGAFGATG
jgi:hypothetical protein